MKKTAKLDEPIELVHYPELNDPYGLRDPQVEDLEEIKEHAEAVKDNLQQELKEKKAKGQDNTKTIITIIVVIAIIALIVYFIKRQKENNGSVGTTR